MPAAAPPISLTTFVGREQEVVAVRNLLGATRLLTLTGAGGSGKTRLASEAADQSREEFSDGVIWVELAPLRDPEFLAGYVFAALGIEQGSRPALEALLDTLRERAALLVLDNCEHLVDVCARLADTLLRSCPRLRILATSREALGIDGERAWLVTGLRLPENGGSMPMDAMRASEAVRLFVDRAQAALATFELTPSNVSAVAQICRRLDGLPLALELAAARVRSLPPAQLAERLDDSFRLLTAGPRATVPRHRTLREAIDWSYALLDDRERVLLQRLSVFAGEFALEAAELVGASSGTDARDIVDVLGALVDKSLVVMREAEGTARYHLLETIRQYGRERLAEAGVVDEVLALHARTYAALAAEAAPHFITRNRRAWTDRILREIDNVRVALTWSRDHDPALHLSFSIGSLGWFWYSTGLWSEGRRWLEQAIVLPGQDVPTASRAATLLGAGVLSSLQAQTEVAIPWLEESAAIARSLGDRSGESYALAYLGVAHGQTGHPNAPAPTHAALDWFRESNDLYGLRLSLVVLSTLALVGGDLPRAIEIGEEGAAVAREYGLDRELAISLQVLATPVLASGDLPRADALYREALAALRRDPSVFWTARLLQLLGWVACRRGQPLRGARLLGAAQAQRESIGASQFPHDRDRLAADIATARAVVGDQAYDRAFAEGSVQTLDEAIADAMTDPAPSAAGISAVATSAPTTTAASPTSTAAAGAPVLEVRALGPLEILRDGVPVPADAWRYARPRELFLYLLSQPEGRTREQVGLTFWPDASPTQVRNNFHVTLHHVRKAIGRPDLITFEGDRYRVAWEAGVRFDARTFEEEARAALRVLRAVRTNGDPADALVRLQAALANYRGDFLDQEGAGDWHLDLRDRLRRLFSDSIMLLGDHQLRSGLHAAAAESYQRAIAAEELHEVAHRRLMTALSRDGERGRALRHYERLVAFLRDEGMEPEEETTDLVNRLRRSERV